jgi:hypothetical protein
MVTHSRAGMLSGLSARGWYVVAFGSIGVLFIYLAAVAIVYATDAPILQAPAHPVRVYAMLAGFIVLAFVITGSRLTAERKSRKEVARGYTTLPFRHDNVELRDSKTGQQLRAAGERNPVRRITLSLRKARRNAQMD